MQILLGYACWESFTNVIKKAEQSCENNDSKPSNHLRDITKVVAVGSKTKRRIGDMALTRYACYLIAQNSDPAKQEIAFAQTYFATQARRYELLQKKFKDLERVKERHNLQKSEKRLSGIAYQRGFDNKDFGIMRSKGDQALFKLSTQSMKMRLGIPHGRPLADFADTVIIKGKDFAAAMTAYNTENKDLYGVINIIHEHVVNNTEVRNALIKCGIVSENVPPQEDVRKVERRLKSAGIAEYEQDKKKELVGEEKEFVLHRIDIAKDLWKFALLIATTKPAGIVMTQDLYDEIPKYIEIPEQYNEISEIKKEPKFKQVVRNLKSNKGNSVSMFSRGYATDIRGDFQITKQGLDFVKEAFKDFVD